MTGPAPIFAPSSKMARMTAKFSDSLSTPMAGPAATVAATIVSITPFSASA